MVDKFYENVKFLRREEEEASLSGGAGVAIDTSLAINVMATCDEHVADPCSIRRERIAAREANVVEAKPVEQPSTAAPAPTGPALDIESVRTLWPAVLEALKALPNGGRTTWTVSTTC